jgi:hypothetical protein
VQEKGREAALVVAKGLAEKQQGPTIYGVLSRGAMADDGPAWLLGNLAKIDPAVELDRGTLVVGTVQWLMADRSPAEGMDWAAKLPDEDLRKSAVSYGMQSWLQLNSMDAPDWVSRMPTGVSKDMATASLVTFLAAKGDSAMATQWLDQITNREHHANQLGGGHSQMIYQRGELARKCINTENLENSNGSCRSNGITISPPRTHGRPP